MKIARLFLAIIALLISVNMTPALHAETTQQTKDLISLDASQPLDGSIDESQKIIEELFNVFMSDWKLLPDSERRFLTSQSTENQIADIICTYIANMTDMYAIEEHQKLFDNLTRF